MGASRARRLINSLGLTILSGDAKSRDRAWNIDSRNYVRSSIIRAPDTTWLAPWHKNHSFLKPLRAQATRSCNARADLCAHPFYLCTSINIPADCHFPPRNEETIIICNNFGILRNKEWN